MNYPLVSILRLALGAGIWAFQAGVSAQANKAVAGGEKKHFIVTLKEGVDVDGFVREHRFQPRHRYDSLGGFSNDLSQAEVIALRADESRVLFVEEDGPVSLASQTTSTGFVRMNIPNFPLAHVNHTTEPLDVDAAIIDTGIDPHEDLNVFAEYRVFSSNHNDSVGHGTSVAGVISALDNNTGTVGVPLA